MKTADRNFNLLIIAILMLVTAPAYAYLDSGTGSVIIQMLFAGVAGLLAILKMYWEKCKAGWRYFCNLFNKGKITDKPLAQQPISSPDKKNDHDKM
ncbi:MAG: hypothetical protein ACK4PR_03875 [Gammaproteobacteria bacterium]